MRQAANSEQQQQQQQEDDYKGILLNFLSFATQYAGERRHRCSNCWPPSPLHCVVFCGRAMGRVSGGVGVSSRQVSAESICLLIQNAHSTQRVALLVCLNLAAGNLHFSLRSQAGWQLEYKGSVGEGQREQRSGWSTASAILTPRTVHGVKS